MNIIEQTARRFIPSLAKLSYNNAFKSIINTVSRLSHLLYPEFRALPPAHLRLRVGVGNKLFFNQLYHLHQGQAFWQKMLFKGLCKDDSRIVEIGCGCGRIAKPLFDSQDFLGEYYGIDIDKEMLQWCQAHMQREGFHYILSPHQSATYSESEKKIEHTSWKLPIEDASIDLLYSTSLFTHLLEPELCNYLQEAARLLKPGGTMSMTFFSKEAVAIGGRWNFKHRIGSAWVENLKYPEAAVAYSENDLIQWAQSAGFSSVHITPSSGQSELLCTR